MLNISDDERIDMDEMHNQTTNTLPPNEDWHGLLIQEQLKLLYQALPSSIGANIFLGCVLITVQWPVISHHILFLWLGALITILVCRLGLYLHFRRHSAAVYAAGKKSLVIFRWLVLFTGITWGCTGIFLFPQHHTAHQLFIPFVLAGLTAGAITSLSMDRTSAMFLVAPAVLPIAINLLILGNAMSYAMSALLISFVFYVLSSSSRLQKDLHDSVQLRAMASSQADSLLHTQDKLSRAYELLERSNAAAMIGTWEVDIGSMEIHGSAITKKIHEVPDDFTCPISEAIHFYKEGENRETIARVFRQALEKGTPFDVELILITYKGNERWVKVIGTPLMVNHRCVQIYGTFQDITERRRIERLKSEFISTVSHELRTPLTSINGSLGLLKQGSFGSFNEQINKLIDIAHKNSQRLSHLINDLLDMDKLVAGKMQFDLQIQPVLPLVEQAIVTNQGYADQFQVTLKMGNAPVNPLIQVDAMRFQQILANLLSNAIKYSPKGESILISITAQEERVRIAITDHGPGISTEFRQRIFEKFSQADSSDTRSKGGTGLGLAITRELTERMGGSIGFKSETGKGATFFVDFTCCQDTTNT